MWISKEDYESLCDRIVSKKEHLDLEDRVAILEKNTFMSEGYEGTVSEEPNGYRVPINRIMRMLIAHFGLRLWSTPARYEFAKREGRT